MPRRGRRGAGARRRLARRDRRNAGGRHADTAIGRSSAAAGADRRPRRGLPASVAIGEASARAARRHACGRAGTPVRRDSCRRAVRGRGGAGRSRGDARAAPHEGGGGALDRARRSRRCLAGHAGDRGADPPRRRGGRRSGRLPQRRRGRLKVPAQPASGCGLIVLAMGKMGAGELNYSSDIDLIVLYDAAAAGPAIEPGPLYVRLTRMLVKLLQQRTSDGYVYRTDLRLRPDPAATQIAISTTAALDYYETRGQNWERAALIKARPCAGDLAAGQALLDSLSPFVWRKYLDFAAVADIHAMKRQIHAYRGHDEIAVEGHNIKLGRGGIREIEFFVQTQQLIAGGRHPELRIKATLEALDLLADRGWIAREARDDLAAAYRFLRVVENRLQMVADEQTHTLPADRDGLERFARFAGFPDRDTFAETLLVHLRDVQRHYATLFENAPAVEAGRRALHFPPAADDRETLDHLTEMGFRNPLEVSDLVRRWA